MKEQTKPMILVVDDLSINRMILRNILSGEYEIDEASNGEEALHKIQSKGADYSLVISDNHMEKMDGLEFLGVMSKNPWLRKIPVIMVSSDKNADFVDKAYALGAADFFFIPFVPSIIRHRVKYTLENYRKHQEELLNSVHIAGEMYFVMMQMDLEKDTCEILDTSEFSDMWDKDISLNATKTIRLFTQYGYIHPDDLDAFLEFTLPSRLKELFLSGTVKTHFRYRRKYKDKYYWALMEISRTADYSETNQTVVMVSRDIQEEVDQQKQTMNMVSQNSISTDFCNITRNFFYHDERASYVNETVREFDTITQMIEWGAEKMSNEKERKQFLETFDRENLIRLFASGHKTAGCEHFYRTPETGLKRFRTSVQMFRNVHTKDVEGIYYVEDIGQEFIHRQVAENLYYQEYIFVGIWDTKYGDIYIHKTGKDMFQKDAERVPYQEIVDYRLGKQSLSLEDYRQKTSKEYVLRQLDNFKTSSFTFDSVTDEGRPCTLEYVYRYFDEENGLVAVLVRNITDSVETDNVTQAMNQKGFVREVEWYLRENPNNDYAILYFNIREFKAINEVLGYEKGNALLQFTQDYLSTSELQPIFTARIMADQFACLVKRECITDERMRKACRTEIKEEDLPLVLRMNCGIYHVEENETNVRGMLDKAKMTLSVIKNEFTSPYATFEKELQDSYVKQMMIMNDIPNALGRGEFVVYYQPIFDAKTERMVSAEAL